MSSDFVNNTRSVPGGVRPGFTVWLTGLSGAGKTTLAEALTAALAAQGRRPEVLDGDVVRTHLSKGLGFSREDRDTNIRRIAFVSQLVTRQGGAVIVAAISPYRETRDAARALIGDFVEVYVACPLEELVRRDVKGLYAKALRGEIANFTGVSDPYEPPLRPEVTVHTDRESVAEGVAKVLACLQSRGYIDQVVRPPSGGSSHLAGAGGERGPAGAVPLSGSPNRHPAAHANGQARGSAGDGTPLPGPEGAALPTSAGAPGLWGHLGQPHGGRLTLRQAPAEEVAAWRARLERDALPRLSVSPREACDLELLGNGALSPLEGFLGPADYRAVVRDLRLAGGLLWPIPVVLGATESEAAGLREGQDVALISPHGVPLAVLHLREKYLAEPRSEALEVYRTTEDAHPGVAAVYARGPVLLGGRVTVLQAPARPASLRPYLLGPAQTRHEFATRGWRSVVAFQTRNPVHRAHEFLLKTALEGVDGLLLHPLVGETKSDDIPADVRLRCYEALLAEYFPAERVLLSALPAAMRYAGPREAIFHALMRKNYGCTHFIVGRDHAGVGDYYGTYDAQRIFEGFTEVELGIRPLFYEHTFYCTACAGMASAKTCPHGEEVHLTLSGTRVRELLRAGEPLPPEFTRPEVAAVLTGAARQPVMA